MQSTRHTSNATALRSFKRWREAAVHLIGPTVVAWVLFPVFFHSFVVQPMPPDSHVAALRDAPDLAMLSEIAAMPTLGPEPPRGAAALELADRWLAAERFPEGAGEHPVQRELSAADLQERRGIGALPFASLFAADVFVQAFQASGRRLYLETARDLILGFARYERRAWRDRGFLWNDHAIAARVGVTLRFWAEYRAHAMYTAGDAGEILQHVARSVSLLSMPSHFTAWSNHGVMQNVAILQAAAAFPGLFDADDRARLAVQRLKRQWPYYLSDEGVVLEHSAGYHELGHRLLSMAVRLMQLNGMAVPPEWPGQLDRATEFLARITRPDGTLPAYGDTVVKTMPLTKRDALDTRFDAGVRGELFVYPVSGYAVWTASNGLGPMTSHVTITWSHFPRQAHKHADESGLILWAHGRGWITPSGYAPYGSELRAKVEGWPGSNAPHGLGEPLDTRRHSALLGSTASAAIALLDIRRVNEGGHGYRRQILSLASGRWLVIDQPLGDLPWPASETIWTFYPDLLLESRGERQFLLRDVSGAAMVVSFMAGGGVDARAAAYLGSREPFAGWVAADGGMQPAPALRTVTTSRGWIASWFDLGAAAGPVTVHFDNGEHWRVAGRDWEVRRAGPRLETLLQGQSDVMTIVAPPETSHAREAIGRALAWTTDAFPRYRNVDEYRLRMAGFLSVVWLVQLCTYALARRWLGRRARLGSALVALTLCWVAVAAWLGTVYFAV